MFCVKCGANIRKGSRFCTACGEQAALPVYNERPALKRPSWPRSRSILLMILSIIASSLFWVYIYDLYSVSTEDEAVNIIVHLIETVGRQSEAWGTAELVNDTYAYAISDECVYTPGCIEDAAELITTMWADIANEREEISNLWSKEALGRDLESYFSSVSGKNLSKLRDVFRIYFPEEADELDGREQLL